MKMKLFRLTVGLPFAILMWPSVAVLSIFIGIAMLVTEGHLDEYDRRELGATLLLPITFTKHVLGD